MDRSWIFRRSGAVVPLSLDGLGPISVTPRLRWISAAVFEENVWRGFLPASGPNAIRWKSAPRQTGDGKHVLHDSWQSRSHVRRGGCCVKTNTIDYRVLQGELNIDPNANYTPGENFTDVQGNDLVGWKTVEETASRSST